MKSLRHDVVVHEVEPLSEVEYRSPAVAQAVSEQPEQNTVANLELIWSRRRLLYKAAIRGLIISTILVFLIPNRYQTTISIMPPEPASEAGAMISALLGKATGGASGSVPGLTTMAGSFLGLKTSGALFADVLRSRTIQDHIVDKFNLQKVYWKRYKEDARKKLDDRTDIKEDRKSGVIHISVTDSSRTRARDIGRAYVEELDLILAKVSTSSARRERIFIENRLVSVKRDLEDAEKQFSAFASKNTTLDIKEQTKAMVESAAVLQGQLIVAQSELESLSQIYTDSNVRVRAMRGRVDELKRQLQKMEGTDASLTNGAASSPDELYPSIRKLPILGVEWADLYRNAKVEETVYELLTQQYELARIQEAKEIPTVNVIDAPDLPEDKSFPPRLLLITVLTLFSVIGAAAWIIGSDHWNKIDPDDPGKRLTVAIWRDSLNHMRSWSNTIKSRFSSSRQVDQSEQQ